MPKNQPKSNDAIWYIIGAIATIYILNFGAGIIEFVPDNAPVIGNIDEVIAVFVALKSYKEISD